MAKCFSESVAAQRLPNIQSSAFRNCSRSCLNCLAGYVHLVSPRNKNVDDLFDGLTSAPVCSKRCFQPSLSNEIGNLTGLLFRQAVFFFRKRDALHQESHIPCQRPHRLESLQILLSLSFLQLMYTVPILAGGDRHTTDRKSLFNECNGISGSRIRSTPVHDSEIHNFPFGRRELNLPWNDTSPDILP